MKAIQIDDTKAMRWEESPDPTPKEDEVVVSIVAAGVNRADLLQRLGRYPAPSWGPQGMGLEISGVVEEVGSKVTRWQKGDRVASIIEGGGYAEKVAIPEGYLLPVPADKDLVEAAAFPEAFITAYLNIYIEAEAKRGDVVLIHAGASGVGTAALQLCQLLDNPTFTTASGPKLESLRPYKPLRAIDRNAESFLEIIKGSEERGVDVILDLVGGSYLEDNVKVLKPLGRMVTIGLLGGTSAPLRLDLLLSKRLRLIGSVLRGRSKEEKCRIISQFREKIWPFYTEGKLLSHIAKVYPIEEVEAAHEQLRTNANIGKVLLKIREEA